MADSPTHPVRIPDDVLVNLCAHAREAFPDECCGYLLVQRGIRHFTTSGGPDLANDATRIAGELVRCRNAQPDGEHPTHPERGAETGFVIAGRELFDFARAFSSERPPCVVYHSHTNGRAYFSSIDRENALAGGADGAEQPTYPVQHLVIGVTAAGATEIAMFAWDPEARDFVEISRVDVRSRE